jgi:hypothetical protein
MMGTEVVIFEEIRNLPAYRKEDVQFLVEHKQHLQDVLVKTHIWRTDVQKNQIINDVHFPTVHAKFHQAILEQKVQFENSLYLAKDFEEKKLEIEELELDTESLGDSRRDEIKKRKLNLSIKFKSFELQQMAVAMKYRMEEIKGWQEIIDKLLEILRKDNVPEDTIWNKNEGDFAAMFYYALNNGPALDTTTDSAERGNILAGLHFVITQAKAMGSFDGLVAKCNTAQLATLRKLGAL